MSAFDALSSEIRRVLDDAFPRDAVEDITILRGGRSGASVYAVTTAKGGFVVRVPDPARPEHEVRCARELGCMAFASERGIGPTLCHADRSSGITVSVRIEHALEGSARARAPDRISRLAALLRRLHDGPPLPAQGNIPALLAHLERAMGGHGTSLPARLLSTIRAANDACLRFGQRTPCHNDLNPGNILETVDRAYLIDWEVAGWGDPFVDLAQIGVFGLSRADAREELLAQYLGRTPDVDARAHAIVARVVALGTYAVAFTAGAIGLGEPLCDEYASLRTFDEVVADLARGKVASAEVAAILSQRMHEEASSDEYRAALRSSLG